MIDLYYWPTPNGHKITIFLEETGTPYTIKPVDIGRGEQFAPDFLAIAPNNRMPAIVDTEPADGGEPIPVFESGAILVYLAAKTGRYLPRDTRAWVQVMEWLCWQIAGLGPMAGQTHHFLHYAPEKIGYGIDRYVNETARLYAVLDKRLQGREFVADEYSIADMACYPWIVPYQRQNQDLRDFPNLQRWFAAMQARPAVQRAYEVGKRLNTRPTVDEDARKFLFGQNASTVRR
ncbi:MAG: glutathione S-transferase N-terminal domain-containing protein [Burkholderiales bacterium]|nr:glutathione S-transferase N-terminal domain-containing protein [Burkholderiales bacterium]